MTTLVDGDQYAVVRCVDIGASEEYLGKTGMVINSKFYEPEALIELLFDDGKVEVYWPEEVELTHPEPDWEV